jgi:hypothetical protein
MVSIKELLKDGKIKPKDFTDARKKYGSIAAFYRDEKYFKNFFKENKRDNFRVLDMVYLLWCNNGQLNRGALIQKHSEFTGLGKVSSFRALQILLEKHLVIQLNDDVILPQEVYDYYTIFYKNEIGVELAAGKIKAENSTGELLKESKYYGLVEAPKNEEGVKFLFARNMEKLNVLRVLRIEQFFPDATVVISEKGKPKKKFVEFEYNSSSFITHGHLEQMKALGVKPEEIWVICWEHDGTLPKEIEIKELRKMIT